MSTLTAIQNLSRKHLGDNQNGSDRFCLSQSIQCWDELCLYESAIDWAIKSLAHSVGIFHPDYQKAVNLKAGIE